MLIRETEKPTAGLPERKRDRRKIAAERTKEIKLAMRQVVDSVAIQINDFVATPEDCRSHSPPSDYCPGPVRIDRMKVLGEAVFCESVVVRVPIEAKADVIVAHVIRPHDKSIAC